MNALEQLTRLLRLKRDLTHELNERGVHLLNRCIYAKFLDCLGTEYEDGARLLIHNLRKEAA